MNDNVYFFDNNTNYVISPNNGISTLFNNLNNETNNINNNVLIKDNYFI